MGPGSVAHAFRLAPMSGLIRGITLFLFVLPFGLAVVSLSSPTPFAPIIVLGFFASLYAFVWLFMRPTRFVLSPDGLVVVWPLRQRRIPRSHLVSAERVTRADLGSECGILLRFGAGGLWGGFGLLWSSRGKHLSLFVSRHADGLVLVRCDPSRSLLITPERPSEFAAAFEACFGHA